MGEKGQTTSKHSELTMLRYVRILLLKYSDKIIGFKTWNLSSTWASRFTKVNQNHEIFCTIFDTLLLSTMAKSFVLGCFYLKYDDMKDTRTGM